MAKQSPSKPAPPKRSGTNPLAEIDGDLTGAGSHDLIYQSIMRGGGEPFGRPWAIGISSLTDKVVKLLKQKGFFAFESLDGRDRRGGLANKFTRYGASRFFGRYRRAK